MPRYQPSVEEWFDRQAVGHVVCDQFGCGQQIVQQFRRLLHVLILLLEGVRLASVSREIQMQLDPRPHSLRAQRRVKHVCGTLEQEARLRVCIAPVDHQQHGNAGRPWILLQGAQRLRPIHVSQGDTHHHQFGLPGLRVANSLLSRVAEGHLCQIGQDILQHALVACGVADDHDVGMVVHEPSFCAGFGAIATR